MIRIVCDYLNNPTFRTQTLDIRIYPQKPTLYLLASFVNLTTGVENKTEVDVP